MLFHDGAKSRKGRHVPDQVLTVEVDEMCRHQGPPFTGGQARPVEEEGGRGRRRRQVVNAGGSQNRDQGQPGRLHPCPS